MTLKNKIVTGALVAIFLSLSGFAYFRFSGYRWKGPGPVNLAFATPPLVNLTSEIIPFSLKEMNPASAEVIRCKPGAEFLFAVTIELPEGGTLPTAVDVQIRSVNAIAGGGRLSPKQKVGNVYTYESAVHAPAYSGRFPIRVVGDYSLIHDVKGQPFSVEHLEKTFDGPLVEVK